MLLALCLVLAAVWGGVWAAVLQFSRPGRFLAARRTWLAVVIGVGVDLLILLALLPVETWLRIGAVIAASSLGVIVRAIYNECDEHMDLVRGLGDEHPDAGRQ
jgi:hypothetical protein